MRPARANMHMIRRCNGSAEFQRRQLRGTQGCRRCQHEARWERMMMWQHIMRHSGVIDNEGCYAPRRRWDFQLPPQISNFASTMAPTRGRIRACDAGRLRTDQGAGILENKTALLTDRSAAALSKFGGYDTSMRWVSGDDDAAAPGSASVFKPSSTAGAHPTMTLSSR